MKMQLAGASTPGLCALIAGLAAALGGVQAHAEPAGGKYAQLAPIDQYLMDRDAEIALARSAAPDAISRDATVLVLGPHGYETAVKGTNGFVCMVERGWVGTLDWEERLNPKIRGADCLNPPAARSVLPLAEMRTEMVLTGRSRAETLARLKLAYDRGEVPALEPGAMSYMMGKGSYLTDAGSHNGPHVMFFMPFGENAPWGAGLPGSPFASAPYWMASEAAPGLPPMRVFVIGVARWSDGSPASAGHMHEQ